VVAPFLASACEKWRGGQRIEPIVVIAGVPTGSAFPNELSLRLLRPWHPTAAKEARNEAPTPSTRIQIFHGTLLEFGQDFGDAMAGLSVPERRNCAMLLFAFEDLVKFGAQCRAFLSDQNVRSHGYRHWALCVVAQG
jgi:hypothetical protein